MSCALPSPAGSAAGAGVASGCDAGAVSTAGAGVSALGCSVLEVAVPFEDYTFGSPVRAAIPAGRKY